ncbi:putative xylitol dehydrogenase [Kockovaella imperatae]|uniref:Putative xylitol dehydrogenase n=1 Tax=Kockovaella imperatae TaxID=4999 RepID=A0A1Y1UA17_9TREE|nr:putative xylitol dehydrogenase [Kockovaella imperatae]ORX33925.1 putative xylitol dehydrogenase [Kockovaella imperatae]
MSTQANGQSGSAANGKSSQKAVVCHGKHDLRVDDVPIPTPGPGEVQIQVAQTGLCGSDLHYFLEGGNGGFAIQTPLTLGHEACGIVSALGPDLPAACDLKVGDKVAMEVGIYCKSCQACKIGRYNLCSQMKFRSSAKTVPHLDGTLREYMTHPADLVYRLPSGLDLSIAGLSEPLSVVLHAYRRAHLDPGSRVLVLGAGAVGLLTCALAKASGCSAVVAVDIEQGKLDFAQEMGWTTGTYCLPRGPRVKGVEAIESAQQGWNGLKESEAVQSVLGLEHGFDAVFECTGVESCMQMATMAAAIGSKVLFVGMGTAQLLLPTGTSILREVDLIGVFRYANTYPAALALLGSGQLGDVSKMITHRYSLENAVEAFEDLRRGKDKNGKTVIKPMIGVVL